MLKPLHGFSCLVFSNSPFHLSFSSLQDSSLRNSIRDSSGFEKLLSYLTEKMIDQL
jgi:hypothetical protein